MRRSEWLRKQRPLAWCSAARTPQDANPTEPSNVGFARTSYFLLQHVAMSTVSLDPTVPEPEKKEHYMRPIGLIGIQMLIRHDSRFRNAYEARDKRLWQKDRGIAERQRAGSLTWRELQKPKSWISSCGVS
jgi:hypothetical protein